MHSNAALSAPGPAETAAQHDDAAAGRHDDTTDVPASLPLALEGSLRWHDTADRDLFDVRWRETGDAVERPLYLTANGAFRAFGALPARVDVIVHLRDDPVPLRWVGDVTVREGLTCRDPRLQGIDVTTVRRVEIAFVDRHGAPIQSGLHLTLADPSGSWVTTVCGDGRETGRRRNDGGWETDGTLAVVTRYAERRAIAWADGYRRQPFVLTDGGTVVLERAPRIEVRIAAPEGVDASCLEPAVVPIDDPQAVAIGTDRLLRGGDASTSTTSTKPLAPPIVTRLVRRSDFEPQRRALSRRFAIDGDSALQVGWLPLGVADGMRLQRTLLAADVRDGMVIDVPVSAEDVAAAQSEIERASLPGTEHGEPPGH